MLIDSTSGDIHSSGKARNIKVDGQKKMTLSITLTAIIVLLCYTCISYPALYSNSTNIYDTQGGGSSFAVVTAFSTSSYQTCTHHSVLSSPSYQHTLTNNHHRIGNGIHSTTFTAASSSTSSTKLSSSTPTSTETSSGITSKIELQKLTIKQLKEYINDNSIIIPKGRSKDLKLKKDIVNFIWDSISNDSSGGGLNGSELNVNSEIDNVDVNGNLNGQEMSSEEMSSKEEASTSDEQSILIKKKKKRSAMMGKRMPPLPSDEEEEQDQSNNNKDDTPYILTPKDRIVLDVLHRYPPLHDSIINACT